MSIPGEPAFNFVAAWARPGPGLEDADAADVGVDSTGRVYVFSRSEKAMLVLNPDGTLHQRWGSPGMFVRPHSLFVGPDDTLWLTDTGTNNVREFSPSGDLLRSFEPETLEDNAFTGRPFAQCTHVAIDPYTREIFVSDGYLNASVHRFAPDGTLIKSWGSPGSAPGQFCIPHNLVADGAGFIHVADRHNSRIQVFDHGGVLHHVVAGFGLPNALHLGTYQGNPALYAVELSPMTFPARTGYETAVTWSHLPEVGHRVTIRQLDGSVQATLAAAGIGDSDGQLAGPHGIAVDSAGSIYVAELSPRPPADGAMTSIVKLENSAAADD